LFRLASTSATSISQHHGLSGLDGNARRLFGRSQNQIATGDAMPLLSRRETPSQSASAFKSPSFQTPPSDDDTRDEMIHTGQQWEAEDVRNVRFMHRTKEVNPRWAIDLVDEVPVKVVHSRVVSCDGGGGALGHPR